MNSIIETNQVTKEFVTKRGFLKRTTSITRALDQVNVTINENEIFGLIGESGSGKTSVKVAGYIVIISYIFQLWWFSEASVKHLGAAVSERASLYLF